MQTHCCVFFLLETRVDRDALPKKGSIPFKNKLAFLSRIQIWNDPNTNTYRRLFFYVS